MRRIKIDIAHKLNYDLRYRVTVRKLYDELLCQKIKNLVFDFSNVSFVSRAFMDEFYNVFLINSSINTAIENLAPDIDQLLKAVISSQKRSKESSLSDSNQSTISFSSIPEVIEYLENLTL